jgi:hypothetical protein
VRVEILLAALAASAFYLADDANWVSVGGAGNFSKNKHVRMVKEDVRIRLADEVHVHATFWFKNEGPKAIVTMAFPDSTSINGRTAGDGFRSAIRRFTSTVDGKPVKVWRQPVHRPKNPEQDTEYRSVWLKKVPFETGQSRVVTVDYVAEHGAAGNGWMFDSYVLETGATWKGRIGECRLTVDWSAMKNRSKPMLTLPRDKAFHPATWTWLTPHKATVTLRNIEPDFDLDLTTIRGFWNFTFNGRPMAQNLGLPDNDDIRLLRGAHADLVMAVDQLGSFFGTADGTVHEWKNPIVKSFGGTLKLLDRRRVRLGNGKSVTLARPATGALPTDNSAGYTYVYLKDLIRALGGTYTYVPGRDRVDITLGPTRK